MASLGDTVIFRPHAEHGHLVDYPELAAIVGALHADGTASLFVMVPNKEGAWMDAVPEGTGDYSFSLAGNAAAVTAAAQTAHDALATADAAHAQLDKLTAALNGAVPVPPAA